MFKSTYLLSVNLSLHLTVKLPGLFDETHEYRSLLPNLDISLKYFSLKFKYKQITVVE